MTENFLLVPIGDHFLGLTTEEFYAALERGRKLVGSTATPPVADGGTPERLLTAQQVSDLTDVPSAWYLEQARQRLIPHVRFGKYVRFDLAEVKASRAIKERPKGPERRAQGVTNNRAKRHDQGIMNPCVIRNPLNTRGDF